MAILRVVILVLVLCCLALSVQANTNDVRTTPTAPTAAPTMPAAPAVTPTTPVTPTAPVGRGPAAALALEQRGPVRDMCQAQQAMQQLIATSGGERVVGDYRVAYILGPPRGWYMMQGTNLVWRAPMAGETQHIEAVVLDSLTGKMLPVTPTIAVLNAQGGTVQSQALMFLWHPLADHYGANFSIPNAGAYTIRVQAPVPPIGRHSRELGNRFTTPVNVDFTGVQITPMAPPPNETGAGTPAGGGAGAGMITPTGAGQQQCPPSQMR